MIEKTVFGFLLFWIGSFSAFAFQDTLKKETPVLQYDQLEREHISLKTVDWDRFLSDKAFDYTEQDQDESWLGRIRNWLYDVWTSFWRWVLGGTRASGFVQFLIQLMPYLMIGGLIALFVWLLSRIEGNRITQKQILGNGVKIKSDGEIIKHSDIQSLINKAVSEKNFRLAIRYSYLLVLQELSNRELIDWKDQKTNADYLREMQNSPLRLGFAKITNLYDFIWYGNFELDEMKFQKALRSFEKLRADL